MEEKGETSPSLRKKRGKKTGNPLNPCHCVTPMLCETGGGGRGYPRDLSHDRKKGLRFWRENLRAGKFPCRGGKPGAVVGAVG